jgi:glycosyltransferase involved in cell wall biosynthesis
MTEEDVTIISIITVVYNNASGLEDTINSVINQSYKNIEYIVIDGNSTDGTLEVINMYSDYIDKMISEPDNGIYDAMNKGIDLANGDYIIFLNSGDIFYDNNVLSAVFSNKVYSDVIFGNHCQDFGSYKSFRKSNFPSVKDPMPFCHQSVFVKTEILKKYKFNLKYKICSDRDQFIRIFKLTPSYKYFNITISQIEAFGTSNKNRIATLKELKRIYISNNIKMIQSLNFKIFIGYCISIFEFIFGKKVIHQLRRLKKQYNHN